jgi:hypothetical protein
MVWLTLASTHRHGVSALALALGNPVPAQEEEEEEEGQDGGSIRASREGTKKDV